MALAGRIYFVIVQIVWTGIISSTFSQRSNDHGRGRRGDSVQPYDVKVLPLDDGKPGQQQATANWPAYHRLPNSNGTSPPSQIGNTTPLFDEELRRQQARYHGPGYYVLPNPNGCGGRIEAEPGYQYGQLVSPNWPKPYPQAVTCNWTMQGFYHVVFYLSEMNLSSPDLSNACTGDLLTMLLPLPDKKVTLNRYFCRSYNDMPIQVRLLVFNKIPPGRVVTAIFRSYYMAIDKKGSGFVMAWMKFPAAELGFAAELTHYRGKTVGTWKQVGNYKTGYYFYVPAANGKVQGDLIVNVRSKNGTNRDAACGEMAVNILHFGRNEKVPAAITCQNNNAASGTIQFKFDVPEQPVKARAPWVIEVKLAESSTEVNIDLSGFYITPSSDCTTMVGQSRWADTYGLLVANDEDTGMKANSYLNNKKCGYSHTLQTDNPWDSFVQVSARTDMEESPGCVYDYFQVGGKRICGNTTGMQKFVSPTGPKLYERVGGRYTDIADRAVNIVYTVHQMDGSNFRGPLNTNLSDCYRSSENAGYNSFWEINLNAPFFIHGLSITAGPSKSRVKYTINLFNHHHMNASHRYGVVCWSGHIHVGPTATYIPCDSAPLHGRYVRIAKTSPVLTLCRVKIYINSAEPHIDLSNVARMKRVVVMPSATATTGYNFFYDNAVDGDRKSCSKTLNTYLHPVVRIDLKHVHRIYAVSVVTGMENARALSFMWNVIPRRFTLRVAVKSGTGPFTVCRYVESVEVDNNLINCEKPVLGRWVLMDMAAFPLYLCELMVYAVSEGVNQYNIAIHRTGEADSSNKPYEFMVDGSLWTCKELSEFAYVNLGSLFFIESVVVNIGHDAMFTFYIKIFETKPVSANLAYKLLSSCEKEHQHLAYLPEAHGTIRAMCNGATVGRYVWLDVRSFNSSTKLSVCEIQVIAVPLDTSDDVEGLVNVALYKYAAFVPRPEPSTHGWEMNRDALKAVDGARQIIEDRVSCATSGFDVTTQSFPSAMWFVDLGNLFRIRAVHVFPCDSSFNASAFGVQLHIRNPLNFSSMAEADSVALNKCPVTWTLVSRSPAEHKASFNCQKQILSRYVVVYRRKHDRVLCMCEVEVMSKPQVTEKRFGVYLPLSNNGTWQLTFNFSSDETLNGAWVTSLIDVNDLKNFSKLIDCGEMIMTLKNLSEVSVKSPNYPQPYASSNDSYVCHWSVQLPSNGSTEVEIVDLFLAPHPDKRDKCNADILLITTDDGQQSVLCEQIVNQIYTFHTFEDEFLHLTFMVRPPVTSPKPINRTQATGFHIKVSSYKDCSEERIAFPDSTPVNGTITSPLYPRRMPYDVHCRWTFTATTQGILEFVFLDFVIVGGQNCTESYVKVYSRNPQSGQNLTEVKYCNEHPPQTGLIVHITNEEPVIVTFKNYEVKHNRGFLLQYQYVPFNGARDFGILTYLPENSSSEHGQHTYTSEKPSTWTFSSLGNVGVVFLDLPFISNNERTGSCLNLLVTTAALDRSIDDTAPINCGESYVICYLDDVAPFTTWTIKWPDSSQPSNGTHQIEFCFHKADPTGKPKVFVAGLQSFNNVSPGQVIRFSNIIQQNHFSIPDYKKIYILESGLYLVAIRVDPGSKRTQRLELLVNDELPFEFRALGYGGAIASVTGTFKLYKGDFVSVRDLDGGEIGARTLFTMIYVSAIRGCILPLGVPVLVKEEDAEGKVNLCLLRPMHLPQKVNARLYHELVHKIVSLSTYPRNGRLSAYTQHDKTVSLYTNGGSAFTGIQGGLPHAEEDNFINFRRIITLVGNIQTSPSITSILLPYEGIYWVTFRSDYHGCGNTTCELNAKLTYFYKHILYSACSKHNVPSTLSVAEFFAANDIISVRSEPGKEAGTDSLLSLVYLQLNKKPYTGKYTYLAFTGRLPKDTNYNASPSDVLFGEVKLNAGCMNNGTKIFRVQLDGYYLVSVRPVPDDEELGLYVKVNGKTVWSGFAEDHVPMGQTSVLPLKGGDTLQVFAGADKTAQAGTLFSVAFVHPNPP